MLWLLRLLHQPGERLCYGFRASQERINVSAIPTAPCVFFQSLSSHLAYPGFSEQCGQCKQRDNWHYEQDQQYHWCSQQDEASYIRLLNFFPYLGSLSFHLKLWFYHPPLFKFLLTEFVRLF